ncbi:MAG: hypothetical protein ACXVAM_07525 [Vulcanimicrobiaceae bacterium]
MTAIVALEHAHCSSIACVAVASWRACLIALIITKMISMVFSVKSGEVPFSRLYVPVLLLLLTASTYAAALPRPAALTVVVLVDLALVAYAVRAAKALTSEEATAYPEQRIESVLLRYLPPTVARVGALEITLLLLSRRALQLFLENPKSNWSTYTDSAKIKMLVLLMPIFLIPDFAFVHLVLPLSLILKIIVDLLGIYSCVWVWGMYASMALRPHRFEEAQFIAHRGILNKAVVPLDSVIGLEVLPIQRGILRSKATRDCHYLGIGGEPGLLIRTNRHITVQRALGKPEVESDCIFVASDRPSELSQKIVERQCVIVGNGPAVGRIPI